MKNWITPILLALLIAVLLLIVVSFNHKDDVEEYMTTQGYSSITLDRKYFGSCCGLFSGCKGAETYRFKAIKNRRKVSGKVCYKNCWIGRRQVEICSEE
ncbi:MAG: hypothetical protein WC004_03975 [Candidatus Absconditabacterales bacterium]